MAEIVDFPEASLFLLCFLAQDTGFFFSIQKPPFDIMEGNSMLLREAVGKVLFPYEFPGFTTFPARQFRVNRCIGRSLVFNEQSMS